MNFIYRPPNSAQNWVDTFELQMEAIDIFNMETHVIGDININFLPNSQNKSFKWKMQY